jgi:hypothetical protein
MCIVNDPMLIHGIHSTKNPLTMQGVYKKSLIYIIFLIPLKQEIDPTLKPYLVFVAMVL